MNSTVSKCPLCGKVKKIVKSNNPLVAGICEDCLNEQVDYKVLSQANFFCRTYNLPWMPDKWCDISKECGPNTFSVYVDTVAEEYPNSLYHDESTSDLWGKMDKEWAKCLTHEELIAKIKPIKEAFIQRMQIKWGEDYTLQEYLSLENLYTNTLKMVGNTNPVTVNNVKKVATISVLMDRSLAAGEMKAATEQTKMYKILLETLDLGDIVDNGDSDTLQTVSEICDFLEQEGFDLKYYDGAPKDVVDKTIADYQLYVRNLVTSTIGLRETYDLIENSYKTMLEKEQTEHATAEVSIEDIIEQTKNKINNNLDAELDAEDFMTDINEVEDAEV